VLGIDVDEEALAHVEEKIKKSNLEKNVVLALGNFKDIAEIAHLNGFDYVDGIVFDLGVSSHQLDTPGRGFSFQKKAPLDMRMDQTLSVKAVDLINILSKGELYDLFNELGQEHNAWIIATRIVRARGIKRIETTTELAELIRSTYPRGYQG